MRNVVTTILPPKRWIMVPINPPMSSNERALIFTLFGKDTATVDEINRGLVRVTNESDKIAPIMICVGSGNLIPAWLNAATNALRMLKGQT